MSTSSKETAPGGITTFLIKLPERIKLRSTCRSRRKRWRRSRIFSLKALVSFRFNLTKHQKRKQIVKDEILFHGVQKLQGSNRLFKTAQQPPKFFNLDKLYQEKSKIVEELSEFL